jgi:energy-coupling factor transporter ATP-binding protein EcfA2
MARYALVVGVAKYKSPLSNLSKTESDAKAVRDLLKQHGDFEDIQVLTGDVTAKQLEDALGRLLTERAERNEALIYFSGHAVVVKGNFGKKRGYLALSNTGLKTSGGEITGIENGIALDDLSGLIGEAQLSNLVVLLDCCHSETLLEESQGFLQRAIVSQAFAELKQDYFLVSACRKFEEAYAMKSESYSIFTGAMLRGLAKERANDRGVVDASTMFGYVAEQLRGTGQEAVSFGYGRALRIVDYRVVVAKSTVNETCPYVGLQAFDQNTAQYFCGRASQIDLLLRKIEESRFVPVIGASGSGKSSLVKAGLMPALLEQGWCVLPPIKPWIDPLANLKKALVEQFYKLPTEIKKAYAKLESEGLNTILPERSLRVLLVVDQFEELFTVCTNEQERQEFIRLLTEGSDREGRLTITTTMRADFVEQALQYPALAKLIQQARAFWLVPLEPSELREAITKPAEMQGYELSEGLLEVICRDVEAEKHCLPLLEFALTELWERRDQQNHCLTLSAYTEMGQLRGALDRHAQRLYEELPSDLERDWTRRLFLQLVRTGQDVKDTRQRQNKQFLLGMARSTADQEAIANVLEIFAGAEGRLLTMGKENHGAFVDLAHEALMDSWQMFAEWRSQDRDLRRLADRVKDAFLEWIGKGKNEDYFLPNGLMLEVREQLPSLEVLLSAAAREYYLESERHATEKVAFIEHNLKEIKLREEAMRVLNLPFDRNRRINISVQTINNTGKSLKQLNQQILELLQTLLRLEAKLTHKVQAWLDHGYGVNSVAFSSDGRTIFSCNVDNILQLYDSNGNQIGQPFKGHKDSVYSVAFSPDGKAIVSGSGDKTVRLWDLQDNRVRQIFQEHDDSVYSVAFSPDGKAIVSGSGDKTVRLWDLQDNQVRQIFQGHDTIYSVAFSPDGKTIIVGSASNQIRFLDLQGNPIHHPLLMPDSFINSISFNLDGRVLLSSDSNNKLPCWDSDGNRITLNFRGDRNSVWSITVSSSRC